MKYRSTQTFPEYLDRLRGHVAPFGRAAVLLSRYVVQAFLFAVLGPIVAFRFIFTVAAITLLLTVLVPGLLVALYAVLKVTSLWVVDFFVHPGLSKIWVLLCFLTACFLLATRLRLPSGELPTPKLRRGRRLDSGDQARQRAIDNIIRRREALKKRPRRSP